MGEFPLQPNIPYTYREYALIPPDGRRHELIEGDLYVTPAPNTRHQTVSRRLQYELMRQLEEIGLAVVFDAPFDVILSDTSVVQPDLCVLSTEHKNRLSERGLEGIPDLVVEILSPSSKGQDQFLKRATYARFAIPEFWLVDPELNLIEVLGLEGDGYRLLGRFDKVMSVTSRVFPQVSIALNKVFAPV